MRSAETNRIDMGTFIHIDLLVSVTDNYHTKHEYKEKKKKKTSMPCFLLTKTKTLDLKSLTKTTMNSQTIVQPSIHNPPK